MNEQKYNYRSARIEDIPQIAILMNSIFGYFDNVEKIFEKWITNPLFSTKVVLFEDKIIGVTTWHVYDKLDFSKYQAFGNQVIDFLNGKKVAGLLNLAILPEHRQMGIAKKLSLKQMDWLVRQNCDVIFGTSWVYGTENNSQHLFQKAGFKNLGESTTFLREQLQGKSICSVCQTSDCVCNMIFFGAKVDELIKNSEALSANRN